MSEESKEMQERAPDGASPEELTESLFDSDCRCRDWFGMTPARNECRECLAKEIAKTISAAESRGFERGIEEAARRWREALRRAIGEGAYRHFLETDHHEAAPLRALLSAEPQATPPIDMVLHCPKCGHQHVDAPEPGTAWTNPPHRSHKCHSCSTIWRPTDVPTNGVATIATHGKADTWPTAGPPSPPVVQENQQGAAAPRSLIGTPYEACKRCGRTRGQHLENVAGIPLCPTTASEQPPAGPTSAAAALPEEK